MKVDIIKVEESGETHYDVYPSDKYGEYDGKPMFTTGDEYDAQNWTVDHGHTYLSKEYVAPVPAKFLRDLEAKCDRIHADMIENAKKVGWEFETHVTYRASAAWKDEPIHYAYFGDFGSVGTFKGFTDETYHTTEGGNAHDAHERLQSIAEGVWELGFTLTFNKDGKHRIFGISPRWMVVEEGE